MITGSITERRDIPHEEHEWMTLRLLGWQQLEEARDARARRGLQHIKTMGTEIYAAIQQANAYQPGNGAGPVPQDRDIEDTYDKATLLRLGIAAWSYPEPVTPETIGQLDEVTAKWAMGAILGVVFMRSAEDRGNAIVPSTLT